MRVGIWERDEGIRAAVEAGDIPLANRLLGRPFGFSLEVIHGNHILSLIHI